jgi:hypothetical protein
VSFSSGAFDTDAFDEDAFDFGDPPDPPDPVLGTLSRATIAIGVGISLVLALLMPVALGG